MPKLSRLCPEGIPQYIIQRGNNRQICFCSEEDLAAYAGWLKEYSTKITRTGTLKIKITRTGTLKKY